MSRNAATRRTMAARSRFIEAYETTSTVRLWRSGEYPAAFPGHDAPRKYLSARNDRYMVSTEGIERPMPLFFMKMYDETNTSLGSRITAMYRASSEYGTSSQLKCV